MLKGADILHILSRRLIYALTTICLLLIGTNALASGYDSVVLTRHADSYSLTGHVSYLKDPKKSFNIDYVKSAYDSGLFKHVGQSVPNFGVTKSAYWVYFFVENNDTKQTEWWLEFDNPIIDKVDLYLIDPVNDDWERQYSGDHRPLLMRSIKLRKPVFKLKLEPQESKQVFLRLESLSAVSAAMTIWRPDALPYSVGLSHLAYGLFYGGIIALMLYNLMLYLSIRDINYLYYCGFVSLTAIYLFCGDGLGFAYLWPSGGQANLPVSLLSSNLGTICLLQFSRTFLRGKQLFPRLDKAILILMAICPFALILYITGDEVNCIRLHSIVSMIALFFIFSAGVIALRKGLREARYYMLAWSALIFGIAIYHLRYNGFLPSNFFTVHAMQMGSILETVLLSFALAHRMKILKEENEYIQEQAKQSLEKAVQERTEELNTAMQKLENANIKLKESSFNDGLTSVRNRAYFEEHFEKEWFRCRREGKSLALLMLDIDHFKHINDTYGHLCGDHALIALANTIKAIMNRPGDVVARYGGEEFIIILPNTNLEGARFIAERIRRDLEKQKMEFEKKAFMLTVSIGCASMVPRQKDLNPHKLVDAADKALYIAKESGRNRVHAIA